MAMADCVSVLDQQFDEGFSEAGGKLVRSRGEGDSYFGLFDTAEAAVESVGKILSAIARDPRLAKLQLRTGIHAGASQPWAGDYYGPAVNRCARLREAANPGQVLVSEAVAALCAELKSVTFRDLGVHRLRDLMQPERVFQLEIADLPCSFGPPNTLTNLAHNLPIHPTTFIGREADQAKLLEVASTNRLTTVVGPGGMGKTRLTLQVAAEIVERFKDGAWFVDLAKTDRGEAVLPIVCSVVEPGIEASEAKLFDALRSRQLLLILDNCEHLYGECRKLVSGLIANCRGVHVLATSRRPLDVKGEFLYRLGGLALPADDDLQRALEFDGVRLFVERVAQRGIDLALSQSTLGDVVGLCRQVDGMPLGIEIVAGQTDVLSVAEIRRSLANCLEQPSTDASGDDRHATMTAAIGWSRQLLSADARAVLDAVAYFPDTWTLEAMSDVCLAKRLQPRSIELVKELVGHSLVNTTRTMRGDVRFVLLQTTRQVVSAKSKPTRAFKDRFTSYCGTVVDHAAELLASRDESAAHELVELEWETIALGLQLSYKSSKQECAELALKLRPFWMRGSRLIEAENWYAKLAAADEVDVHTRGSVQVALSSIYILLGENNRALSTLLAAEQTLRPVGGVELARVVGNLAVHQDRIGQYYQAREGFETCVELFRSAGSTYDEGLAFLNLGVVMMRLDEPRQECDRLFRQALERATTCGSASLAAKAHSSIGQVAFQLGNVGDAVVHDREALQLWQVDPNVPDCALTMLDLAEIWSSLGQYVQAATATLVAERLEELSHSPFPALHLARMEATRSIVRPHVSPTEWRAAQRMTRSKSSRELITIAITLLDGGAAMSGE